MNETTVDEIMALVSEIEDQALIHACGEGMEPDAERAALRHAITAALAAKDAEIERLTAQLAEPAKPGPGEWIEWKGSATPPIADGVKFKAEFVSGNGYTDNRASEWAWDRVVRYVVL